MSGRRRSRTNPDLSEARQSVQPLRPSAAGEQGGEEGAEEILDAEIAEVDEFDEVDVDGEEQPEPEDLQEDLVEDQGRPEPEVPGTEDELEAAALQDHGHPEGSQDHPEDLDARARGEDLAPSAKQHTARGQKGASAIPGEAPPPPAPRTRRFGGVHRLYEGQTRVNFVGRRKIWFAISLTIIVAGIISLGVRGFNFGIEFKGGTSWTVQAPGISATKAQSAVVADGVTEPVVELLGGKTLQVQADLNNLSKAQQTKTQAKVSKSLADLAGTTVRNVSVSTVGPTWGSQVSKKAIEALIAFFIVVTIYISLRFEWKMAIAALVAVMHDLLITAGVYSLSGLQVTPDTVIAVLTILGYSLYDTVVVFDRVRENSKNFGTSGRMTYSDMVNLSMNQTLARSINTSLVAILPVLAVLVVGAELLGATTLQDFGLALFIGLLSGAYSSIFIAAPVLAVLKEREPRYKNIRQRLATRGDRLGVLTPAAAAALGGAGASGRPGAAAGAGGRRPAGTKGAGGRGATGASGTEAATKEPAGGVATEARPPAGAGGTQGARRPPPRPRKGGSKSKSKKRRR